MKFKTKFDFVVTLCHLLLVCCGALCIYYGITNFTMEGGQFIAIIAMVMGLIIVFHIVSKMVYTVYIFEEDGLLVKSGITKQKIPYKAMLKVSKVKKLLTLNCLSLHKLCIEYRSENGQDKIHVSPGNQDEFIKQMKVYCKSLKVEK